MPGRDQRAGRGREVALPVLRPHPLRTAQQQPRSAKSQINHFIYYVDWSNN